jgi:hypothetical protein
MDGRSATESGSSPVVFPEEGEGAEVEGRRLHSNT